MLQTHKSWELESRGQLLGALFNQPGLRHYPCVEIPLNLHLFHIDVVFGEKPLDDQPWSRFIFDQLFDVLKFIERDDVVDLRMSLQSKRCGNEEYTMSQIIEILEGKNRDGHKTYLYKCSNHINHVDSHIVKSENELSEIRTIWSQPVCR